MAWQLSHAARGPPHSSPHTCWPTSSGGVPTIISCVPTERCEWRSSSREREGASWWRNATGNELRRWHLAEQPDDGRQARCSHAPCRRFPLERLTSQRWVQVSCRGEMGKGAHRSTRMEAHAGKRRPVWTASSPKTVPKWVCRGLGDLSTISHESTVKGSAPE